MPKTNVASIIEGIENWSPSTSTREREGRGGEPRWLQGLKRKAIDVIARRNEADFLVSGSYKMQGEGPDARIIDILDPEEENFIHYLRGVLEIKDEGEPNPYPGGLGDVHKTKIKGLFFVENYSTVSPSFNYWLGWGDAESQ